MMVVVIVVVIGKDILFIVIMLVLGMFLDKFLLQLVESSLRVDGIREVENCIVSLVCPTIALILLWTH